MVIMVCLVEVVALEVLSNEVVTNKVDFSEGCGHGMAFNNENY